MAFDWRYYDGSNTKHRSNPILKYSAIGINDAGKRDWEWTKHRSLKPKRPQQISTLICWNSCHKQERKCLQQYFRSGANKQNLLFKSTREENLKKIKKNLLIEYFYSSWSGYLCQLRDKKRCFT